MFLILSMSCAPRSAPIPTAASPAPEAPSPAPEAPSPEPVAPDRVRGTLTWSGEAWQAELSLPPGEAFLFETQHGAYREGSWAVEGARIEHHGFDVLIPEAGAETVRFTITPPEAPVRHLPMLGYADGTSLFATGQLTLATVEDLPTAIALEGRWSGWKGTQLTTELTLDEGSATARRGSGPYVHSVAGAGTSSLDSGLPDWIRTVFEEDYLRIEGALSGRFGGDLPPAVTHVGYGGSGERWSNQGFASPREIGMRIQTSADPADEAEHRDAIRWFFAHERVHHHQLAKGVGVRGWPLEGAADTLASATMVELGLGDRAWLETHYEQVRKDCVAELKRGPIRNAPGRVQYVCGDVLNLAAWSATGDLVGFWNALLDETGRQGARVDGSFYVYALGKHVSPEVHAAFERFETEAHPDAEAALDAFWTATGVLVDGELKLDFVR